MDSFMECTLCARQPGSPTLCLSCQHNRNIIDLQKGLLAKWERQVDASRETNRIGTNQLTELRKRISDLEEGLVWCSTWEGDPMTLHHEAKRVLGHG